MHSKINVFPVNSELRELAEQRLLAKQEIRLDEKTQDKRLIHELQVHQIELEIQNEELRSTHTDLEISQARYFELYDLAPVGYITMNEQSLILEANLTASKWFGKTPNELINRPLTQFIAFDDQDIYYRASKLLTENGRLEAVDIRLAKSDSTDFWVRLEANQAKNIDNSKIFRLVMSDINKRMANIENMQQAAAIFECVREGVIITDANTRILIVNQAFCRLTGYFNYEVIGKTPGTFKSGHQDSSFYAAMWAEINKTGYWQGEIWNRRKNGEFYPALLSISAIRNIRDQITHYVGVFSDNTQINDAFARLDYLAHHDPLTGLANRLLLFSRLEHCISISHRESKSAALLILDLDRFKDVNDSFGHLIGDELLKQVGKKLSNRLRDIDTITRLGGDEFALLLEDLTHPQDAAIVATDIIAALSEPWLLSSGIEIHIGASVGISLFPDNGKTSEELLKQADAALYRAKAEGRGNFKYYSENLTHASLRRVNLESMLRRAISKHELVVNYQPQIEIATGNIIGAEALLRWNCHEEGIIPPGQFIPIAEETGLIKEIGTWVLTETCLQGQRWIKAGLPLLKLAVNLSAHQFRHHDIAATVTQVLKETGFPAEYLELEITESALMERETEVVLILNRLRALGVRLAIDDFGTGYSSLAYLKHFPIDILKIDKSFVNDIPQLEDDMEIAAAIIGMGHILRLKVLAEGVETVEQFNFLKEKGCDYFQGYYKSKAVSAEEFAALFY
ncbi:EAL domain-containing protein [Methylomonas sp. AM2-LC]|uniref:sensor domain-containing protein n=1 Tax=Methylomonas sp. AM2-LC TaxID=3153301 RepID=UPI003267D0AD